MKLVAVSLAVLLVGMAQLSLAEPPRKEVGALEQKLVGAWKGQSPCAGTILFRADGTYERTGYGPAAYDSSGTWKVRWDALPPTMVLTCKTSDGDDEIGKTTELKLDKLDDDQLGLSRAKQDPERYARMKK